MIDLKGGFLMPGLWTCTSILYLSLDEMPLADQVTCSATGCGRPYRIRHCRLRCAGAHHFMDVAWKRAFDSDSMSVLGCSPAVISSHHGRTLPDLGSCAGG